MRFDTKIAIVVRDDLPWLLQATRGATIAACGALWWHLAAGRPSLETIVQSRRKSVRQQIAHRSVGQQSRG